MKFSLFLITFYLLFTFHFEARSQAFGFRMPESEKMAKIPFEYINNFIVLKVQFNGQVPLNFIFDTGAENTLITKKEIIDIFGIPLGRTFTVLGSDLKTELKAHLIQGISLSTENLRADKQDILVLDEDYINFESMLGIQIHGIAAADLFKRLVVKIDYLNQELVLYRSKPDFVKKYQQLDLEMIKSKPYINTITSVSNNIEINTKLLIDTGANISLLLNISSNEKLELPEHVISGNIGVGLGGVLEGYLGRVQKLNFGSYAFDNIIGSFQEESDSIITSSLVQRNGIIGNQLLNRFTIMIDYLNEKLYIKPRRKWKRAFQYDKSGFFFIITDIQKNKIVVQNILENSPASEAGFQKGDVIKSINNISFNLMNLNVLNRKMSRKAGKKIKIKFLRKGQKRVKTIVLRDIL